MNTHLDFLQGFLHCDYGFLSRSLLIFFGIFRLLLAFFSTFLVLKFIITISDFNSWFWIFFISLFFLLLLLFLGSRCIDYSPRRQKAAEEEDGRTDIIYYQNWIWFASKLDWAVKDKKKQQATGWKKKKKKSQSTGLCCCCNLDFLRLIHLLLDMFSLAIIFGWE